MRVPFLSSVIINLFGEKGSATRPHHTHNGPTEGTINCRYDINLLYNVVPVRKKGLHFHSYSNPANGLKHGAKTFKETQSICIEVLFICFDFWVCIGWFFLCVRPKSGISEGMVVLLTNNQGVVLSLCALAPSVLDKFEWQQEDMRTE